MNIRNNLKSNNVKKKKMKNQKIILFVLAFLFVTPFVFSAANYGDGAYGAGVYGQASCGDAVCDTSESCSICSADCGVCPGGGGSIAEPKFIEKINSWDIIGSGEIVLASNFDENFGVSEIKLEVSENTPDAKIIVRKYHSKPEDVLVEAPGIVYKYLQIETQNLENLEKATLKIQIMKDWISENNVDSGEVSLYKFDESSNKWKKLDTNFVNEDSVDYFYDIVLNSFSFFAISGEITSPLIPGKELIPEEIETVGLSNSKKLELALIILAIISLISLLILIFVRVMIKRDADRIIKQKNEKEYLSNYISEYNRRMKKWYEIRDRISKNRGFKT